MPSGALVGVAAGPVPLVGVGSERMGEGHVVDVPDELLFVDVDLGESAVFMV